MKQVHSLEKLYGVTRAVDFKSVNQRKVTWRRNGVFRAHLRSIPAKRNVTFRESKPEVPRCPECLERNPMISLKTFHLNANVAESSDPV